jgi:hypothetical protein
MGIVSKEAEDILYEAELVADGSVMVYGNRDYKSTLLGGMKEESLARILLGHLIREGKVDPIQ